MTLAAALTSGEAPRKPLGNDAGFLGVVMLDTRFPRLPGDVGHPEAFGVPVRQRVVPGAWPDKVVRSGAGLRAGRVAPAFVEAVQALQREGARAITTSCGFLVLLQEELQAAAQVPVITSSLLQLPGLLVLQPKVGVLTISSARLGAEHLRAAGVAVERLKDVVVQGVAPAGEFATAILGNREAMDSRKAGADVVAAAMALKRREPSLACVVLECTNMPPYRQAIEAATGLKTWALTDDERLLRACSRSI
ncbi:MAG: aspartate/glutamate racemase family protein [Polaromonas sp.]